MSNWWESSTDAWAADGGKDPAGGDKWEAAATGDAAWSAGGWDGAAKVEEKQDAWGQDAQQDDAWAKKDDAWGAQDQQRPPPAHDFWDTQKWNKESGVLSKKEDWELDRDDEALFDSKGRAQVGLNFAKYEQVPVDISGSKAQAIPVCKTFEEIFGTFGNLMPDALKDNLRRCNYETPTPVQKFAVPCGLVGRDIMCCAQTGSGKTAAFLIPIIGRMMCHHHEPVGGLEAPFEGPCRPDTLVLTPTRELCLQIYEEALKCCHRTPYRVSRVYGGEKPKDQLVEIAKGTDLMVATPGRFQDFINREVVEVSKVHVLVLDEADRMLDMGFEWQIRDIVEKHSMPPKEERQTMMFSATFSETFQKLAGDYLYDYIWIAVGVIGSAVETVEQVVEQVDPKAKFDKLIETLDNFYQKRGASKDRALIFTNAKDTAKWLDEQLYEKNFDTGALHGNLTQQERERNLWRFRQGEIDVLIATDVAARGLDIENVALVLNYDMPREIDTYIHRIGRTGRIGNEGRAITFLSCDDTGCLETVQTLKELVKVMNNSKATLPDWIEGLIESAEASTGGWSWGGKDARSNQEGYRASATGDAWGNWGKSGGDGAAESGDGWNNGGADNWAKEDPWQKGKAEDNGWKGW